MEQTLQARQLTGLAMEQIYKANVKIGKFYSLFMYTCYSTQLLDSHIEAEGNGKLKILFTLGNLSPFPMKSVKGNLKLEDSKVTLKNRGNAQLMMFRSK